MTNCTYCGAAIPDTNDAIVDHFFEAHVYLVPAPDAERWAALAVDDPDVLCHELEQSVAASFPPGSRTGYFDTVMTDDAAQHMHLWLSSTAIRLAEAIEDEAQDWLRQPDSLRITVRVEPRWAE